MVMPGTNLHHETLAGAIHSRLPELLNDIPTFFALDTVHLIEPCRVFLLWRIRGKSRSEEGPALAERSFQQDLLSPTKPVLARKKYTVNRRRAVDPPDHQDT